MAPPPPPSSSGNDRKRRAVLYPPGDKATDFSSEMVLTRLTVDEAVNAPYRIDVECVSAKLALDMDRLLGQKLGVEILPDLGSDQPRVFNGVLTEAAWTGMAEGGNSYRLVLRPEFWLTRLGAKARIFHDCTPTDIIKSVLSEHGVELDVQMVDDTPPLEYTVQFRETDFDFVSRMMQKYGFSYSFRHSLEKHVMVLTDHNSGFPELPGKKRPFRREQRMHPGDKERVTDLKAGRMMTPGAVRMGDYDFENPTAKQEGTYSTGHGYQHGNMEIYDYPAAPGGFKNRHTVSRIAAMRARQAGLDDSSYEVAGNLVSLGAGMRIGLTGPDLPAGYPTDFVAVRCVHVFSPESFRTGGSVEEEEYQGRYELVPMDVPVVPPRSAPPARMLGPQTAVVAGDGEIDCDEHGRILVKFHWDGGGASSMRCRVMQPWAGKGWGNVFIPRVGMEVVVEFLDGDPDRPIVTGSVYNGANKPPVDLPGDKNISGMRSKSVGGDGYNEFVIDDSAGDELMKLHAQKDLQTKVLNDERREVDKNRTTEVGADDTLDVTKTLTIKAGDKITLTVGMSKIEMTADKVVIEAPTVEIKAGMQLQTSGGVSASHKAGGQMEIKGAVVMIN